MLNRARLAITFSRERVRDAVSAIGFVLAGGIVVNLLVLFTEVMRVSGTHSAAQIAQELLPGILPGLYSTLPPLLVAGLIVFLAPPRKAWRVAACLAGYVMLVGWCLWVDPDTPRWGSDTSLYVKDIAATLDVSFSTALLIWSLSYRLDASAETNELLRSRIDAATLESELQRARLQLLRAQIEPHFLFNTLANIRTLARIEPDAAIGLIDHFMRYLSAALPQLRQDDAALSEEMRLIDAYLNIFRVRMGRRLSYEIVIPADLADVRIPTMMVLTLVENALKHGINPVSEGGFIRISASRDRTDVLIRVADSGRGMQAAYGYGMGLANLNLRLTGRFGSNAQLTLAPAEPRGVVATMRIPSACDA